MKKNAMVRGLHLVLLLSGLLASIAQAQINFRGAGTQATGTGSSLVVTLPSGTQAGDVAILVVAGRPSDTSQPAAPSGWTLRSSALREVGSRDLKIVTYYRVLTGSDTNPTLSVPANWQGGQAGISGQIAVWGGVNTASPFDVADTTGTAAAASPWTPPAITTVTAGARAVSAVASADDNALNFTTQEGFTLRMSGATYDTTTGGDHSVGVADKDQPTAGAVTMLSWGQTVNASDAWVGISFALKPGGAALYFIHADHLDTPRLITNAAQQVVWRWDNDDPFGNNAPNENPSGLGNFTCNLRLPGQYFDKETNLHYNYFRDYDPAIGRYVQSDPIGLAGGINTYAYVNSNPLSYADPTGQLPVFAALKLAAVAVAAYTITQGVVGMVGYSYICSLAKSDFDGAEAAFSRCEAERRTGARCDCSPEIARLDTTRRLYFDCPAGMASNAAQTMPSAYSRLMRLFGR